MSVSGFVDTYFIQPMVNNSGYNIVNTSVYAIILVGFVYLLFRLLDKLKFEFDRRLLFTLLVYSFFAAIFHTLSDSGALPRNFWTVSPGIWLSIGIPIISIILLSKVFEKRVKIRYDKLATTIGAVFIALAFLAYNIIDYSAVVLILFFNALIGFSLVLFLEKLKIFKNKLWKHAVFFQMFDGVTTFATLQFYPNYFEQHVLGNIFINIFGPFGMVIMKVVVILPLLYIIERNEEDKKVREFLFIIVAILGALPGFRDALRLFAGV